MENCAWIKKNIEEDLDHKNLWVTTEKVPSDYRKHRYELVDKPKKQPKKFLYAKN